MFTVTVNEVNVEPELGMIGNKSVDERATLAFTATATDQDLPAQTLTFRLDAASLAAGMTITAGGAFAWTPSEAQGGAAYPVTITVTDNGSPQLLDQKTFSVQVSNSCAFPDGLAGWTTDTSDGSGTVVARACGAVLTEGGSFLVTLAKSFSIPAGPSAMRVTFDNLSFDTTDSNFINDAFEMALVDQDGNSVVQSYTVGRDAFFNVSENLPAAYPTGITFDGHTVTVGLSDLPAGLPVKLIFRLVNNDSDRTTTVRISDFAVIPSILPAPAPVGQAFQPDVPSPGSSLATLSVPLSSSPPPQSSVGDTLLDPTGQAVFTTTEDFQFGTFFNVNTDFPDELQLNAAGEIQTFPFIWIANSGEGTVSRFDTRTGQEIGRYRTGATSATDPSRICVTPDGDAWVANRGDNATIWGNAVKILNTGFIDRNGNGVVDTCQDLNGDGYITGDEVLPWDANGDGQPDDERIALVVHAGRNPTNPDIWQYGGGARGIAVDTHGKLWVGLYNHHQYEVFDEATGQFEKVVPVNGIPYGAVIAPNGILYSASAPSRYLDAIDTATQQYLGQIDLQSGMYGITVDSRGVVWCSPYQGNQLIRYDTNTGEVNLYPAPYGWESGGGISVDRNGSVWAGKYDANGMLKWVFADDGKTLLSSQYVDVPGANGSTKASAVDADGYVWTTSLNSSKAFKIDPATNQVVLTRDTGYYPYNYSDMTGAIRIGATEPTGTWTEIFDSQQNAQPWGTIAMHSVAPIGTAVELRARTSDDRNLLEATSWTPVNPGEALHRLRGRYLQVQIKLTSLNAGATPTVRDLLVAALPPPAITVTQPADGDQYLAGQKVLISGTATAITQVGPGPTTIPNRIVAVLINGTAADVVDAAGNFFARVPILPGRNTFEVSALDAYGQSASTQLTLEGSQQLGGSAQLLFDVSPSFAADYARTSFDEQNKLLYAELAIRNQGEYDADNPFYVGVRNISDPTVSVRNTVGVTSDGTPYYDFSPAVPGYSLTPDEITGYVSAVFHNPNRVQFTYDLVFLAKLNEPPVFTSTPVVETSAGRPYTYDADATDLDGDTLTYSLVSAPPNLKINQATGVITWLPALDDLGVYSLALRVADGRGGAAEQRYLLSVTEAPPNRPPVITTLPITEAAVLTTYRYDVDAVDPDSDPVTYSFTRGETYAEAVLADAPIGYWRLGETSGTTATDASGNHQDATYSGAVGFGQAGGLVQDTDTAAAFDGSTARLVIPYTPPKNNFTIEAWVQTSVTHQIDAESTSGTQGTSGQRFLFEPYWRDSEAGAGLSVGTNGISVYEHGANYLPATAVYSGDLGNGFVHVVVTYTNKQPRIYLNGILVRTGLISPKANVWAPIALALDAHGPFVGTADEVAIYDQPLTPDQILHHYQRGISGPPLLPPPTGMTINDTTGEILWAPTGDDVGSHVVSVRASDGRGGTDQQTFVVVVQPQPGNHPPVIVSEPVTTLSLLSLTAANQSGFRPGEIFLASSRRKEIRVYNAETLAFIEAFSNPLFTDKLDVWGMALEPRGMAFNAKGNLVVATTSNFVEFSSYGVEYARYPKLRAEPTENIIFDPLGNLYVTTATGGSSYLSQYRASDYTFQQDISLPVGAGELTGITFDAQGRLYVASQTDRKIHVLQADESFSTFRHVTSFIASDNVESLQINQNGELLAALSGYIARYDRFTGTVLGTFDAPNDAWPVPLTVDNQGRVFVADFEDGGGTVSADIFRFTSDGLSFVTIHDSQLYGPFGLAISGVILPGIRPGQYTYDVDAVDSDKDPITYSFVTAPPGMLIDVGTGRITWDLTMGDVGSHTITVQASDGRGGVDLQTFTLNVTAAGTGEIRGTKFSDLDGDGARALTQFSAADGFSPTANPNGNWVSGWEPGNSLGSGFTPYTQTWHPNALDFWLFSPGNNPSIAHNGTSQVFVDSSNSIIFQPGELSLHPGPGGQYSVDRFTAPVSGTYSVTAKFSSLDTDHGGTDVHVLVNGKSIFDGVVVATPISFSSTPLMLAAGETIDIAVGYGPNGNYDDDNTGVDVTISATEPGLSGWTIYLDQNQNGRRDPGEPSTVTNANGDYTFTGLPPGQYVVAEESKPGWRQTSPNSKTYVVTLATGQIAADKDFGNSVVTGANLPPEFTSDPPQTIDVDQLLRYPAVAVDPDNDPLTFDLPLAPDGMTVHPELGIVVWQPTREQAGTHQVVLRVRDGQGGVDLQSFTITVVPPNSPPVITSTPLSPAVANLPYVYQVGAQDADAGDTLTFRLQDPLAGMAIDSATGRFTWTPTTAQIGSRTVTIVASDGHPGGEAIQTFKLAVVATAPNGPPVINSTPRERARAGQLYVYLVAATDPNGDPLSYHLDAAPAGMTIDAATGAVSWTPGSQLLGTTHAVTVRVDDGRGGSDTQAFDLTVVSQDTNAAPRVVSNPPLVGLVGRSYLYNLTAEDPEGDPVVWSLDQSPPGMSIDSLRGTIRWTPAADQAGPNEVVVQVRDIFYAASTQSFTIEVRAVNLPPSIDSNPLVLANPNELYVYAPRATDPDGDPLAFRLSAKPTGMTIDARTGLIQWTPATAQIGQHAVRIVVEDGQGGIDSQAYTLNVGQTTVNRPPLITSTPVYKASVGRPYQYTVTATDPEAQPITYSLDLKPDGMSIDPVTGVITWTPTPVDPPTVTVVATDPAGALGKQTFVLTVRANQTPQITKPSDRSISAGVSFRDDVRASDPDGDPITFQLDSGPAGLTMDEWGRIAWTPAPLQPGENSYDVFVSFTARDSYGATDTASFKLTVLRDSDAPTIEFQIIRGKSSLLLPDADNEIAIPLGTELDFVVRATDNVGVTSRSLTFDGQTVPLDGEGRVTRILSTPSLFAVVATARDAAGNISSVTRTIRVYDLNAQGGPEIALGWIEQGTTTWLRQPDGQWLLSQPGSPDQIVALPSLTYLTDVFGSVRTTAPAGITPAPLEYYAVQYARLDQIPINPLPTDYPDARFQTLIEVRAPIGGQIPPVENQSLTFDGSQHHLFDPTLLANDTYVIRVIARDVNGRLRTDGMIVTVDANAKLGNFHLDFTDLQLPVAGIPITITRVYDTLQANNQGDFGYGWSLGVQDAQIRETVPAGAPFVPGKTRVYLTTPEGRRVGFTYKEEQIPIVWFGDEPIWAGLLGDAKFRRYFDPDPGVYEKLEPLPEDAEIQRGGLSGVFNKLVDALGTGGTIYNLDAYILTTKDGLKYRYDQTAGLQTITDLNGSVLTFTETAVTHSSGAKIDFIRDFRGRIKEIVAPDGTSVKYTYNAAGDLLSFTNQAGEVTTYGYLADPKHPHFLDTITDSRDVKIFQAEFDENGRLKGSTDALGNTVSQDFDPGNFTGTITDAKQNVTELLYNERGNVLEKREPNPVDPAHPLVTKYEYADPKQPDKETKITDRNGVVETRVYDAAGNMTQVKRAVGTLFETTTAYVYNARGDVTSIQQNGQTPTVFDYDSAGKLTGIVNAVGGVASATHDASGRQVSFTDFNGNATTYDYKDGCACGSPKKITYADGTYEQFAYNGYGQVTQHDVFEKDGTLVETSSTAYDRQGRVIEETQGAGPSQTVVQKHYDGNLLDWEIIVNPESPNETPATPVAQRKSRITDYAYDAGGRLVTQTDAEGGVVQFRYDANGNRVLLQDPIGNVTTWVYDALNRMVEERDPFYWVDYVTAHAARFAGKSGDLFLAEIVSANDDPSGAEHVRVYGYDGEGNQTKIIDRDQRRREFAYDPLNRLKEERWYDPGGVLVRTIVSTYDVIGNLKSITDPDSTYTYTYDVLNRVTSVDNAGTPDMPHVVLTYQYDAIGNVVKTSDNLGVSVVSTYDSRNRLARRWWEGTGVDPARVDFFYTAAGREKRIDRYSDLTGTTRVAYTDRTYDLAGRSQVISHQRAVDDVIARYDYAYDFAGLLTHEDRSGESYTNNDWHADYTYDRTGQLLGADYSGADVIPEQVDETYRYDANGNRTSSYLHGTGYRTGTANQLLTDGTYNYKYDGEGNMLKKTEIATGKVTTFEYDHRNRMFRATIYSDDPSSGGIILHEESYRYDAFGRRITILSDGQVTKTAYNGDNAWTDFNAANAVVARYLFGAKIDQLIAQYAPGTGTIWALTDHLGTVPDIVGPTGQVINRIAFSAFGQVLRQTNPASPNRYLFTSREFGRVLSMYYYRTRFYNANVGRFVSQDPTGFEAMDADLYRFVGNGPLNALDPLGRTFVEEIELDTKVDLQIAQIRGAPFLEQQSLRISELLQGFPEGSFGREALVHAMKNLLDDPFLSGEIKVFLRIILGLNGVWLG
ncbi:MAG: putative Ig domain-containing protein [Planctomycetota bacterium]|nr:putative Ig domain-containing protein [Planctomycetota bacterium]